jgi:uncharacterized protein YcaQ
VVVNIYAPLPAASVSYYVRRLRYSAPQLEKEIADALLRARERLAHARVDGVDWYWPRNEEPRRAVATEKVRLLAPFDPVVHDRARFEILWGWSYRFEAYTPVAKRKLGYYALPLLWKDWVVGWANLTKDARTGSLKCELGYSAGKPPRDGAFKDELKAELERMRVFLELSTTA